MKTTKHILATITTTILFGLCSPGHAINAGTTWNAYDDFYLSPNVSNSGAPTTPSALGTAWGYYAANANYYGNLPSQIGSYFTPAGSGSGTQSMYQYSSYSPLGGTVSVASAAWDPTGGSGFARYVDNQNWGSSLGRFDTANTWFPGAHGYSQGLSKLSGCKRRYQASQMGWAAQLAMELPQC